MGEEAFDDAPTVWLGRKELTDRSLGYEEIVSLIADHYSIRCHRNLYELSEVLIEIACVSQWRRPENLGDVRRRARETASSIKQQAIAIQAALDNISELCVRFAEITEWSPHILEELFDLSAIGPTGVSTFNIPTELASTYQISRKPSTLSITRSKLNGLASLPLREAVQGRVPNLPLQHAVSSCRRFWKQDEGRPWRSFKLKEKAVRDANCIADLKNECEQFVANMLSACGLAFDLQALHSAWVADSLGEKQ